MSELTALPSQELLNVLSPPAGQPRAPKSPGESQSVQLTPSRRRIVTSSSTPSTTQPTTRFLPPCPEDMHLFVRPLHHLLLQLKLKLACCEPLPNTCISFLAVHQLLLSQAVLVASSLVPEHIHLFVPPAPSPASTASPRASGPFLPPAHEDTSLSFGPPTHEK